MGLLDKYGIKEVADFTFYDIKPDGTPGAPVLFLDTLRVSTIEQGGETVHAAGGKGFPNLIGWDFGKTIDVSLEDALFTMKSMSLMFGDGTVGTEATIFKTVPFVGTSKPSTWADANGIIRTIPTTAVAWEVSTGKSVDSSELKAGGDYYLKFPIDVATTETTGDFIDPNSIQTVTISSRHFPGTYYGVGDTYARSEKTGKDEYFQFEIFKAKITSENTLSLEADGDPAVFTMNISVLARGEDGDMMRLTKYSLLDPTPQGG